MKKVSPPYLPTLPAKAEAVSVSDLLILENGKTAINPPKSTPKPIYPKSPSFQELGTFSFFMFCLFSGGLFGQINRSLHLNENADYVEIPHNSAFNLTQNFTISFWVKAELPQQSLSTPYNSILIKSVGSTTAIPFGFQLINSGADIGKVRVVRKNAAGAQLNYLSTARIDDGRFHYLSLVRDSIGNVVKLYVDATLQGAGVPDVTGSSNNNSSIYLGRKGDGTENFRGSIDEIRIWRTARTQANLEADRNSSLPNFTGLVAYYSMETGLKNRSTAAVSAQSVNGYAGGGVAYYPTQKHYGNALHFDGNNDLVSLATNPGVLTNQLAVEIWVRPEKLNGIQSIAGQQGKWALKLKEGKVNFTVYTTTGNTLNVTSNLQLLNTEKWYHLAAVFNGNGIDNRMELFINGEADNKISLPAAYSVSTNGTGMLIGANGSITASNEHFEGMLDEINVWRITRVADSIALDMNRGATYTSSNHLIYYRCDQGTPNTSNSGVTTLNNYNATNHASLNNFALFGSQSNWVARSPLPAAPNAAFVSGTTYDFQGKITQQGTSPVFGEGILRALGSLPNVYPDYTNTTTNIAPYGNVTYIDPVLANYTFSQTSGSYTTITGGTVLGIPTNNDDNFQGIPIGFPFMFNKVFYSNITVNANGYVAMGTANPPSIYNNYLPAEIDNLVTAMNADLQGNPTNGELRYQTTGTAPNRTLVVQWRNYDFFPSNTSTAVINFQIRLNEADNSVEIRYGTQTAAASPNSVYVGIKGYGGEFKNRTVVPGLHTWNTSAAGTSILDNCAYQSGTLPPTGLSFKWTSPPPILFNYRGYAYSQEGVILSDESNGPCETSFSIGNINLTPTASGATARWRKVSGASAYDWVLTPPYGDISSPLQTGSRSGNADTSVVLSGLDPGSRYYIYVRARCGGGAGNWVGPAYFATLSTGVLTATDLKNDAYVDVEWALPTAFFAQNAPLGVHLQLKTGNTVLYEQPITDYTQYQGEPQPSFGFVGNGNPNQYTQINNTTNWPQLSQWTMETWVKTAAANTLPATLLRTINASDNFSIYIDGAKKVNLNLNGTDFIFDYNQLPVDQWFHLAVAYGGGNAFLHINGVLVAQVPVPQLVVAGATFQALYGANQTSMAELRIWNRIRTAEEIKYSRLTPSFSGVAQNNLLLQWKWINQAAPPQDYAGLYDGINNIGQLYLISGVTTNNSNPVYVATPYYTAIHGNFRHVVGPSQSKPYRLSGYQIGSGAIINAVNFPPLDSGKTQPYQALEYVRADSTPFNVQLNWKNKSSLSEYFRIRRTDNTGQNGVTLALLSGTDKPDSIMTYTDTYKLEDSTALKNGLVYRYYVDTYSASFNQYFDTLKYNTVNLPPINVTASDNAFPNKISLSWNDLSAFGYEIRIMRDEQTLETLPASAVSYTDLFPVYGKRHRYGVLLIDPITNQAVAAGFDRGSIPARGEISGRVYTLEGNYMMPNVRIRLTNLTDNSQDSTLTDQNGVFSFNGLYYGNTGDFSISAYYPAAPAHVFLNTPRTLSLSDAKPTLKGVVIIDSTGFTSDTTNTGFGLTNFSVSPLANQDMVALSFDYTLNLGDTLRLNVFRDGILTYTQTIGLGTSISISDTSGKPNFIYDYKISLYQYQGNVVKVLNRERKDIAFPPVAVPNGFTATPLPALGAVTLSWSHPSQNFDGFRIYRAEGPLPSDTVLLASLNPGIFTFSDKQTLPGTSGYKYVIRANRVLDNLTFESQPVASGTINYPSLPSLSALNVVANTARNSVLLAWTLPSGSPLNDTSYNFDGYLIYRTDGINPAEKVGRVYKHFVRTFEDKTGIPAKTYSYEVRAFVQLKSPLTGMDTLITSAPVSKSVIYPLLKAPANFSRTNNPNNVTLNWTPAVNQSGSARNFDGQTVYFKLGTGPTDSVEIPLTANSYVHYTTSTSATPITFTVRSHKFIKGVKYVSSAISGLGYATGATSASLPIPPQFKASQNLPEHIRLTWNYPTYILATFKIYRDGSLIAVLPTESRQYYDYEAENFKNYFYEIEAVYQANTTLKAAAVGKRNALSSIQGRVYAAGSMYGLPFVEVTASGTGFFARTFTDSTGFYKIDNLPVQSSLPITVSADSAKGQNTVFTGATAPYPSTKVFYIEGESYKTYTLDFVSGYSPFSKDTARLAITPYLYAIPDPARKRVIITWTPSNQLHDGFQIYRANTLIGTVSKNDSLVFYDTEGSPGVNYLYQVGTYLNGPSGPITGAGRITYATFPKVEPVIYLGADQDIGKNAVNVTWSHLWGNHNRYRIQRNGEDVATVFIPSPNLYTDTSGIPGFTYNYTLYALDEQNNVLSESEPVSVQKSFPTLVDITNLTLQIPDSTLGCGLVKNRNHVLLNWDYASSCTGFWLYRNGQLLKVLPPTVTTYRDTFGLPGLNTVYTVKAYLNRNNLNYSSDGKSQSIMFPVVAISNQHTNTQENGNIKLTWDYAESIVSGFEITRVSPFPPSGNSVIYTMVVDSLGSGNFEYTDKTGFMGRTYFYLIRALSKRGGVTYYSDYSCFPGYIDYPSIPAPIVPAGLTGTEVASDGTYANFVKLNWDYTGTNLDGFKIYRNGSLIATLAKGMRNYTDMSNQTGVKSYEIRAWKIADDNGTPTLVESGPLSDDGNIGQLAVGTLPLSLTATQGTLDKQVLLTWSGGGGYTVYRDNVQIATLTGTSYTDNNAAPGKHYIYEVSPNDPANRTPIEGWAKYDGYISGNVKTLTGNVGLGGAIVEAKSLIEGNTWYYYDTTDNTGGYAIPEVYYGDATANYTVSVSLERCSIAHEFQANDIGIVLSASIPFAFQTNFADKTQYKIRGFVKRKYTSCGIDSVKLSVQYAFADGSTQTLTPVYTNKAGVYSININPIQLGLVSIKLMIDSTRTLNNGSILHYDFASLSQTEWTGQALECMDIITVSDFEDVLSYPVKISIVNGCEAPITGGKYKVEVQSTDVCYDRSFTTDQTTGELIADLPPMPLNIRVSGVENLNGSTQQVVEFLKYRPVVRVLDSLSAAINPLTQPAQWASASATQLVYHKPPEIIFTQEPFTRHLCNNLNTAIVEQGKDYSIKIQVQETFGTQCIVKSGEVRIRNAAAVKPDVTLKYDASGVLPTYAFKAGEPNLVKPYLYNLYLSYYSTSGELLAEKNMNILVEGSSQLPGSDIILDISREGNAEDDGVPIPLYVLRDPPGDGSFSKIESGSSVTKRITLNRDIGGGAGLFVDGSVGTPVGGVFFELGFDAGRVDGKGYTWEVQTTTKQEIATGNTSFTVGADADVIVGMGMAFRYGLTKKISAPNNCQVIDATELGIAPNGIKTEWIYTINQIEVLIKEYKWRIARKDRIKRNDILESVETSAKYFQTKIDNWNAILDYYKSETLPHYNLCNKKFEQLAYTSELLSAVSSLFLQQRQTSFREWQTGFCTQIGHYDSNGKFVLNDSIDWDQPLIDKYNVAETVLGKIIDLDYDPQGYDWQFSQSNLSNTQKYMDVQYNALHGIAAENITFSAGVEYSKSIESAKASSSMFRGSTFFKMDGKLGINFESSLNAVIAPLGVGIMESIVDYDIDIGAQFHLDVEIAEDYEKSIDSTNVISYTLTDNEQFDQYSVTIIQGIEPNQTPYFVLLGGRSACPYQEGTIGLDRPSISLIKEGGATQYDERLNVNPDEPAVFTIQINNGNPFGLARDIQVVNLLQENPYNAVVELLGDNFADYTLYQLPPDQPIQLQMMVHRGAVEYDYDSLKICVMPRCYFDDPDITYTLANHEGLSDTITFSVHFANPCSDIVLSEPEDNWVINRKNLAANDNQEALPLKVAGFDVTDNAFRRIYFEYRKIGANNDWIKIPGSVITKDSLATYQALYVFPNEVPYYWFIWDITDDFERYPNGEYQIRAVAECLIQGKTVLSYTNYSRGTIDRNMQLLGLPEPADQIWTYGDEIAIRFMQDIQCNRIDSANFVLVNKNQMQGGTPTPVPGRIFCQNNRLRFIPDAPMNSFDGDTLRFTVSGVYTVTGERMNDQVWSFAVSARDLYMDKTKFELQIYQGEQMTLQSQFYNNGNPAGVTYFVRDPLVQTGASNDGTYENWFTARNACQVSLPNVGDMQTVYFDIDGQQMNPGFYEVSFEVRENLYSLPNALTFKIQVLPKPSDWTVNPALYEHSMSVMANYQFVNPSLPVNTDTTDLISVWIDNEIRGVGKIQKIGPHYLSVLNVYGNASDNGRQLSFRLWDTETSNEYDAHPPTTKTWQLNSSVGLITNPMILSVDKSNDLARYIPFAAGWNLFSLNTNSANDSLNKVLSGLRHPQNGDVIKTATKSATYDASSQSWITANGLHLADVYHGYQLRLQQADTLRITGILSGTLSKDSLFNGWNLIGAPLNAPTSIHTLLSSTQFLPAAQPDSMLLKTTALPGYAFQNMTAVYKTSQNPRWLYAPMSGMDAIRPNFGYWLKVNKNTNLCLSTTACSGTTVLRTAAAQIPAFDEYDISTWVVNPSAYEFNMLLTGVVRLNGQLVQKQGIKVAAFTGKQCRGVGELVFVPELDRYLISLFVYANTTGEPMEFRIYDPATENYYKHYEAVEFEPDGLRGNLETPYVLSNHPPDNQFSISAYPNPFDRKLMVNISAEQPQAYTLSLCDLMGRAIYTQSIAADTAELSTELKTADIGLIRGVYILHLKGSLGESKSMKVVFDPN